MRLTMPVETDNNATRRADNNRKRRLDAHRTLDELLALMTHPEFTGSVTLEINGQSGLLGRIRKATNCYVN